MPEPIPFPSAVSPVRRALVSVHDKTGIVELARELASRGVRIISTGGTAAHLKREGIEVASVEETTGFPEILGGRVVIAEEINDLAMLWGTAFARAIEAADVL